MEYRFWLILYQGKLVGYPSLWWQLGPKAVGWEELVTVIVLDDFSHCLQGHGIGAELVGTHVVQGSGLQGIPCRDTGVPALWSPWSLISCIPSLFYSIIHVFTYSSIFPPTHTFMDLSTGHKSIFSLSISIHLPLYSLIQPSTHPAIHPYLFHSFVCFSSYGSIHLSTHPFLHLLTCYFPNLNICPFVRPHTHLCIHWFKPLYSLTNPSTQCLFICLPA